MKEVIQRLNQIMQEKNLKQIDLTSIAEVTPQAVNNWFKRGKISTDSARKICLYTGHSLEWLLSGKEPKKININDSNIHDTRMKATEWESMNDEEKNNGEFIRVPVLDIELSAGNGCFNEFEKEMYTLPFRAYTLKSNGIQIDKVKVVKVSGDSMEPKLSDHDTISINIADTRIRDGKIYAVRVYDSQKVKILIKNSDGTVTLRSLNPVYKDEIISKEQIENGGFKVLGRMWWHSSIDN